MLRRRNYALVTRIAPCRDPPTYRWQPYIAVLPVGRQDGEPEDEFIGPGDINSLLAGGRSRETWNSNGKSLAPAVVCKRKHSLELQRRPARSLKARSRGSTAPGGIGDKVSGKRN